ncbi:DUF4238 domain-containing protein [Pseudomonas hormoni]|uniref:DUF4238 domain-containing protein n=1 Tax=Pseudomonas hormoni TaxID=3093767 RepID=A0ABX8ESJ0_9PSED|nr:DUF4238 domain-containing protein [Pseudomonas hormoni]QVW21845.1 DUF4238 domain-containing protein [Pseudomonas hormoni]
MHLEEKVRQHYVSRLYLNSWIAPETTSLWSLNKTTGKTFKTTNLSNIAQKNRFYKVIIDDIVWDMLKYLLKPLLHEPFVAQTMRALNPLLLVNRYRENKLDNYEKLVVIETNFLEDRYADLEGWFVHTIKKISAAGCEFSRVFEEDREKHYDSLMLFFATQHFRTQRARQRINDITKEMYLQRGPDEKHKLSRQQVDTVTKIHLYVESVRFAKNLSRSNFKISLDYNVSNIDLVTSSSPTLGRVEPRAHRDDITSFMGQIPLTPKINMRLYKSSGGGKKIEFGTLGKQKVLSLNRLQVESSDMDVYATSERQLQFFLKLLPP